MKRITITCVDPSDETYTGTIVKDEKIYNYFNLEVEADKSIARKGLGGNMYKFALRASLNDLRANYEIYAYELFVALIGILTYNTLPAVAFMLITLVAQYAVFIKGVRRVIPTDPSFDPLCTSKNSLSRPSGRLTETTGVVSVAP